MSDEDTDHDGEDWFERALEEDESLDDAGFEAPTIDDAEREDEPESAGDADGQTAEVPDGIEDEDDADDGGLFDEDFTSAFGDAGGDFGGGSGEFSGAIAGGGFGDDGGGSESFEEDPDSELSRIELGIEGLDDMIQGGVPERSLIVAIGSAGTGKTTFGLQFLQKGLQQDERAIYITLEESNERIVNSATEKGWAFDEYQEAGQLAILDIDPIEMANSLDSIRSELPRLITDFGASRLVLDSVSLLEMMYDDQAKRRNEIYDFTRGLKDAGVTTMLTSEASEETPYASRHGIIEYLTDAVFILQYVRPSDFQETRLAVEIQKIRDANHSRETKPYDITGEGINVYQQANIF